MCNDLGWLKGLVLILMMLSLLTVPVMAIFNVAIPMWHEASARDELYAGEIADKEIINASSGLFSSSGMDYRLIIRGEYEYNGKTKEIQKGISVDKETYLAASVGDHFDSHTLEIVKSE